MPDGDVREKSEKSEKAARSRRGSRIEAMAAATATIVSVASFYVAVKQTSVQEKQLEASVWPALLYDTGDSDGEVTFSVKNAGVGPAKVRSLEVSFRGKPVTGGVQLLTECCGLSEHRDFAGINLTFLDGRILTAGQEIEFLKFTKPKDESEDPLWDKLEEVRFEVDGRVCFCSALDQCWTVGFHETEPAPLHDCTEAAKRTQYKN